MKIDSKLLTDMHEMADKLWSISEIYDLKEEDRHIIARASQQLNILHELLESGYQISK
mgnify:CR=1 FL=1